MSPAARSALRDASQVALLAATYWAAAWLGLRYVTVGHSISLVWPPAGLAFAALVLLGPRMWPGVTLGALLAAPLCRCVREEDCCRSQPMGLTA